MQLKNWPNFILLLYELQISTNNNFYKNSSVEVIVASIKSPKSRSVKLALAVNKSKNVSKGDKRSADGKAAKPETKDKLLLQKKKLDWNLYLIDWLGTFALIEVVVVVLQLPIKYLKHVL